MYFPQYEEDEAWSDFDSVREGSQSGSTFDDNGRVSEETSPANSSESNTVTSPEDGSSSRTEDSCPGASTSSTSASEETDGQTADATE